MFTVGHGTASAADFATRLRAQGIERLVDIRTYPTSRHNPQYAREEMSAWLPSYDISYLWQPDLGGRRKPAPDSPDVALRHPAFRGYAAWMRTPEFAAALGGLLASEAPTTVMCSESVWWKCHRRLVADFLVLARRVEVAHVMPDGRLAPHRPTEGVRLTDEGLVVYDDGTLA